MISYISSIYNYIVNVLRNLIYTNTNTNKMITNSNDLFKELNETEKTKINNFRTDIDTYNIELGIDEAELYSELISINNKFSVDTPIKTIIKSLEQKLFNINNNNNNIYISYNYNNDISIEMIEFNTKIKYLLEKFIVLQKLKNTEYELQEYLDSIVIK
jgi:hypothetical protein